MVSSTSLVRLEQAESRQRSSAAQPLCVTIRSFPRAPLPRTRPFWSRTSSSFSQRPSLSGWPLTCATTWRELPTRWTGWPHPNLDEMAKPITSGLNTDW